MVIWCRYLNDIQAIKEKINQLYNQDKLPTKAVNLQGGKTTSEVEFALKKFRTPHDKSNILEPSNYIICQIQKGSMGRDFFFSG